jgi:uncharacterized protein (TIGR03435 family)
VARSSALAAVLASACALYGQTPPAFDVVSVKHSGNTSMSTQVGPGSFLSHTRWWHYEPGRVTCNLSLSAIIQEAYSLKEWQISAPSWVESETYDFAATMTEGTPRTTARLMMRTMLAERFKLAFRKEQKEFPVFDLVETKAGFKLKPVEYPGTFGYEVGVDHYESQAIPLSAFADWLASLAGRPVFDKTGLAGAYHIKLEWSPAETTAEPGASRIGQDAGAFSALVSIGLKLEPRKAMFDYLIVEHAEKEPTEN